MYVNTLYVNASETVLTICYTAQAEVLLLAVYTVSSNSIQKAPNGRSTEPHTGEFNISTEMSTSGSYIPPATLKFTPASTPYTFLTQRGEEDGHIADSGYFDEFDSMTSPSNSNFQCYINLKCILYCSSNPLEILESEKKFAELSRRP